MARPRKKPEDLKTFPIRMNFTEQEWLEILRAAKREKLCPTTYCYRQVMTRLESQNQAA
jgi:hypothetical protein